MCKASSTVILSLLDKLLASKIEGRLLYQIQPSHKSK